MLNSYYLSNGSRPSHTSANVRIDEHRAPTDESIKILADMQQQARDSLIDTYILEDNEINGSVFMFKNPMTHEYKMHVQFRLNGKKYKFEERFSNYDSSVFNAKEQIYKHMTDAIYNELVKGFRTNKHGGWESGTTEV